MEALQIVARPDRVKEIIRQFRGPLSKNEIANSPEFEAFKGEIASSHQLADAPSIAALDVTPIVLTEGGDSMEFRRVKSHEAIGMTFLGFMVSVSRVDESEEVEETAPEDAPSAPEASIAAEQAVTTEDVQDAAAAAVADVNANFDSQDDEPGERDSGESQS